HTRRLESVATLAGGVAHDLNNILTPMLMAAEVFHDKLTDEGDRELMSSIQAGARRGAAIIKQLLVFSRSVAQVRAVVDVAQLVTTTVGAAKESLPPNITLVERVSADLWPVTADAAQLQQVVLSLCTNGCDAMPNGGTLTVTVENSRLSPRASTQNPWGKGGPCVMISVADTGRGIAPEVIGRVFDPFYTTKEMGKGAGLGLSSVHGIVTGHGGTVTVDSELGHGSVFRIFLPATAVPTAITGAKV
ncbi:MAG: ATP-binding protein, partial [Verrucomicrobia bacterium]|nr:ATP-binding protein [Verrucomicrobiota bacterium]